MNEDYTDEAVNTAADIGKKIINALNVKYKIVAATNHEELETKVNDALKDGWLLTNGTPVVYGVYILQTMTKVV
ncbi:MAG: DUF1737 domain-containing protein [Candidatus Dadabacteria bacterium]|nr:DUF1737 domain-containing protein [Candidatus Dadabacteria bacterium]